MKKSILDYVNKCEGWKTAIKSLHWKSSNLPQHELCDKIAERIADFQDQVSEVEQSMSGRLPLNRLKGVQYKVKDLRSFVNDVISDTKKFYKTLKGDAYIGMRSDCESFLSDMQRNLYLVDFTLKEELRRSLREAMYKSVGEGDDFEVDKFKGRLPKTIKSRINRIYSIVSKYGINSRIYHDDHWQAISDYNKVISSLGCEVYMKPCGHIENADSMQSDGGYCDYAEDGMPRSKQYHIRIVFEDGMAIEGYIKCMAAGTIAEPFSSYDTCMVLWPKTHKNLEESITRVVDENIQRFLIGEKFSRERFGEFAGKANKARNSLGGRIRSMFDDEWKSKIERQEKTFSNAARWGDGVYIDQKGDEATFSSEFPDEHGYDRNYYGSNYNPGKGFDIAQRQYNDRPFEKGPLHNNVIDSDEFKRRSMSKLPSGGSFADSKDGKFNTLNDRINKGYKRGRDSVSGLFPTRKKK